MSSEPRQANLRQYFRWAILVAVGVLGVLITGGVNRLLAQNETAWLEHRFHMAAQARVEEVRKQLLRPFEHLATLQRLFGSVDPVEWDTFRKFTEPMLSVQGCAQLQLVPARRRGRQARIRARRAAALGRPFCARRTRYCGQSGSVSRSRAVLSVALFGTGSAGAGERRVRPEFPRRAHAAHRSGHCR